MDVQFTFNISPMMLEHALSTITVIAILVALSYAVRKFIGE